jgi:tetratricopeptide (TPR) repeat protein
LALDLKNVKTRFALGNAYFKSNQIEAALLEFQKTLKLNPEYMPAYINLGYSQLMLGQMNQARATYEAALLKQPDNPNIHKNLGSLYSINNENPDRAIFHLQEYLRLSPSRPETAQIQAKIETLRRQGQKTG